MKIIQKIKNLFKIYDLLSKNKITIDLDMLNLDKEWALITFMCKRTENGHLIDDLSIFKFETKIKSIKVRKEIVKSRGRI